MSIDVVLKAAGFKVYPHFHRVHALGPHAVCRLIAPERPAVRGFIGKTGC
ncbi:hypothetical protein [Dickeya fangzhongdai]|nr:hypothetical protein [Dickeya fangzhongdai]WKV51599.1 hypothetical protein PL145_04950 [Dickeya fangzhongdai]